MGAHEEPIKRERKNNVRATANFVTATPNNIRMNLEESKNVSACISPQQNMIIEEIRFETNESHLSLISDELQFDENIIEE